MPVLSVSIPARSESTLALSACKFGIEAEKIDAEDGIVYADLFGSSTKTRQVANEVGATILAEVDTVDMKAPVYS